MLFIRTKSGYIVAIFLLSKTAAHMCIMATTQFLN